MQKIPDIICKQVSNDSIMMNSNARGISTDNVVKLETSKVIKADNIVLTGNSNKLIGCKPINYNAVTNLYFSSENFPENGNYIHLFPKDDIINNIAFLSAISSNYSSSSRCLISISLFGIHIDNESLRKNIDYVVKRAIVIKINNVAAESIVGLICSLIPENICHGIVRCL